jgi:hypothetical protein
MPIWRVSVQREPVRYIRAESEADAVDSYFRHMGISVCRYKPNAQIVDSVPEGETVLDRYVSRHFDPDDY